MTTIAFTSVLDALISSLSSASSLSGVRIFDGVEIDSSYPGDAVAIGHDGTEEGDIQPASIRNSWENLGAKKMMEDGVINCSLWSWDGSTDIKARRVRAFAMLSAVDTVIRTDSSFSGVCLFAGLESSTVIYKQTDAGALVTVNFTIAYRART